MINKAVIPAAGDGTRMLDLSKSRPKHLIQVLDKPFLYYVLKNLQSAGFQELILVIGSHAEKMVEFAATDGKEFPITLVNQFEVMGTEKYGTAIPVLAAREIVGDDDFVCVFGDNLSSPRDLGELRQLPGEYTYLSLVHTESPERYGVPILDGDFVKRIVEKPTEFISNWAAVGGYKLTREIFPECQKLETSGRGEYELTDAIGSLAAQGKVKARKFVDYWLDFGRPDDVEVAASFVRDGKL